MREYEPGKEKLELAARGRIAAEHLFGVDIDPEAVEVTRLSLLVAVLGDERIDPHMVKSVLPDLRNNIQVGNSRIDSTFDSLFPSIAADTGRRAAVRPLDWKAAFPAIFGTRSGGFDAVVGNPPYARIQVLAEHLPDQLTFFQSPQSGYVSSQQFNFDEYMLFVERAIELLQPGGVLANILPHRFMTSVAGKSLRRLLLNQTTIERIVHFGHSQVFPGRSTYTCLILMRKDGP